MSALLNNLPRYRRMVDRDLDRVMAIELAIYAHPWTRGNFKDSLREGYHCWIVEAAGDGTGGALHVQTHEVVADMKRGRVRNAIEL